MRVNARTHKRNKAVQQFDQCLKMSNTPFQTYITPQFLRNSLQPTQSYRKSDLSCFKIRNTFSKKQQNICQNMLSKQSELKKTSALISSFNFLSSKLLDAKNLLQKQSQQKLHPKATQIFMTQNQAQISKILPDGIKHDESTLNLESRKLLKNNLNCKQKIVWANSLKHYYIAPIVRGMAGINDRAYEHLYESHQLILQHQSFVPAKSFSPLNLRCHPRDKLKKVLVIDMDQTLIHCHLEQTSNCQMEVQIGDGEHGYISIRPYALSFLKKMSKNYEIIVFTASKQDYADSILNEIDPQGLIKHRLYREHCLKIDRNIYSKDLRIINRDLSQMVLVDNSVISFLCQPQNGVPILPYTGGEDRQLLELQKYLEMLTKEDDVRKLNRKVFKLEKYREYQSCEELAADLYQDPKAYY